MDAKIDGVRDSVNALEVKVEKSFGELRTARMVDRLWWLAIAGAILSVMARSFK